MGSIPDPEHGTQPGTIFGLIAFNGSAEADNVPKNFAQTPQIGEVDPEFEEEGLEQMVERGVLTLGKYRSDPTPTDEIPDTAEEDFIKLFRNYFGMFCTRITDRPPVRYLLSYYP